MMDLDFIWWTDGKVSLDQQNRLLAQDIADLISNHMPGGLRGTVLVTVEPADGDSGQAGIHVTIKSKKE